MTRTYFLTSIFLLFVSTVALGQKGRLEGYVYDDFTKAVADVRVVVTYAEEVNTDSQGHFTAIFPTPIKPGSPIKILVRKDKWVVYKPMFGNYIVPDEGTNAEQLPITIVPLGSPLLLEADRLFDVVTAMRTHVNLQLSTLSRSIDSPKAVENYTDFIREKFLSEYAHEYGVDIGKLVSSLDELTKINESGNKKRESLQQYLLKNYLKSAQLAFEAAEDETLQNQLNRQITEVVQKKREAQRERINMYMVAGFGYYHANQLRQSLVPVSRLSALFENGDFPKEDFAVELAWLQLFSGLAKSRLSQQLKGEEQARLEREGITALREAERFYTYEKSPQNWLRTQINLGEVLAQSSYRLEGPEGVRALQDAIGIARKILEVYSFGNSLPDSVKAQNNLARKLTVLGTKSDEVNSIKYLREAVEIHRSVLRAMEREKGAWNAKELTNCACNVEELGSAQSRTKIALANALEQLSFREGGSVSLLEEAVANYRAALASQTLQDLPDEWATSNDSLSSALVQLSSLVIGTNRVNALEEAVEIARGSTKLYSQEKSFQAWARSQNSLGTALTNLGAAKGNNGFQHLDDAVAVYRSILKALETSPQNWEPTEATPCHCVPEKLEEVRARNQRDLASSLVQLAHRTSNVTLCKEAVELYRSALQFYDSKKRTLDVEVLQSSLSNALIQLSVYLPEKDRVKALEEAIDLARLVLKNSSVEVAPQRRARRQNYLGSGLLQLAVANGPVRVELVEEAIGAHQSALPQFTLERSPSDWALTQNYLGDALVQLGLAKGESSFLESGAEAYRSSLKVYTFEATGAEWARTQNYLGNALAHLAAANGSGRIKSLEDAVAAYRSALRYFDPGKSSSDWALAQSNLGVALVQLGIANGDSRLFEAGVEAHRSTLRVYTLEKAPLEWARSQNYLGNALTHVAAVNGAARVKSLEEAVTAHRAALRYYDMEKSPSDWALTQNYLGFALSQLGLEGSGAPGYMEEAVKAHEAALKVYAFEKFPLDWARSQSYLGYALGYVGTRMEGPIAVPTLQAAINAHRASLKVFTFDKFQNDWAASQNNLGYALYILGSRSEGEPRISAIKEAVEAHRSVLKVYTFQTTPETWIQAQNNLANDYILLQDWTQAEGIYLEILARVPSNQTAYNGATVLYHERVFQFEKAFELTRSWLEKNANDLPGQLNLAENSFTTERFDDCERRVGALVANAEIGVGNKIALQALQIANRLALKKDEQVGKLFDAMVDEVRNHPADFRVTWTFSGSAHFVSVNKNLSFHKTWLKNLFVALGQPDRDSTVRALIEVRNAFTAQQ